MFNEPIEYYQAIANELNEIFCDAWIKVEVEAKRYENSINLKIVYTKPDGNQESDIEEKLLPEYFFELANTLSAQEKGLYKLCRFVLYSNGKFDVEFDY